MGGEVLPQGHRTTQDADDAPGERGRREHFVEESGILLAEADQRGQRQVGIVCSHHLVHHADHGVLLVVLQPGLHDGGGSTGVSEATACQAAHER
jgi:hypothetical protein